MIPVIWFNAHPAICHPKDHWDTSIFQELILKGYEDWNGKPEDFPKAAVVMIAGRFHADDVDAINRTLGFLDGCVVVIHSDEESLLDWSAIQHPNMRRWVMTPSPDTKPTEGVRFIGEGWSPGTPEILADIKSDRYWDVAFLGQVTHPRRVQCAEAIEFCAGAALVEETKSFAAGRDRDDYLCALSETRFAPCPSGPVTADSFRVYEALEAGCVPILDCVDGQGRDAMNLWKLMLGDHPLPLIRDWSFLPALVETLLPEWETLQAEVQAWWAWRKDQWVADMAEDVKAIS